MTPAGDRDGSDDGVSEQPLVSVVLPVFNDPDGLRTTVDSLVEQSYPSDRYEVLVVDNGSTDGTLTVANEYADVYEIVRALEETEIQGSYAARNRGIRNATGDVIAFIDADMWVDDTWLSDAVSEFADTSAEYMGCAVEIVPEHSTPNIYERFDVATGFPIELFVEERNMAPTCCLFVHRSVFEKVGLFDPRLVSGGDSEFGRRVAAAGYEQHYAETVTMYHPARESLREHLSKNFRIGRGSGQKARLYDDYETKPVWDLRYYLPPDPRRFRKRCSSTDGQRVWHTIALYVLFYLTKSWAYVAGRIAERRRPTNEDVSSVKRVDDGGEQYK